MTALDSQRRDLCVGARPDEVARVAVEGAVEYEVEAGDEPSDGERDRREEGE